MRLWRPARRQHEAAARVGRSGALSKGAAMRTRVLLAAVSIAMLIPLPSGAQQPAGRGAGPAPQGQRGNVLGRGAPPLVPDNQPFTARDLSGVWLGNKYGLNGVYEPPLTAEGKRKFDAQKPAYGARVGTPAAADTTVPSGRRRAIPPAQGNDYIGACNPLGLVRLLVY